MCGRVYALCCPLREQRLEPLNLCLFLSFKHATLELFSRPEKKVSAEMRQIIAEVAKAIQRVIRESRVFITATPTQQRLHVSIMCQR